MILDQAPLFHEMKNHSRVTDLENIAMEIDAMRYLDEVLQVEDINLVESVQRGMETPAFEQGRIVHDPSGSGKSEHAVHHFHGLVLDAYEKGISG